MDVKKARGPGKGLKQPAAEATQRFDSPVHGRHRAYLCGSVLAWALGAVSTHWIGLWAGIGVAAVCLAIWGLRLDDRLSNDLLRPSPKLLVTGVLAGLFMLVVTYLGYGAAMAGVPFLQGATGELYRFFASLPRHLIPVAVPVIVVSEEIVWRGRVQALLQERMTPSRATVAAAAVYALAHAPIGSPLLVGVAFACGLFWGMLRSWTGSIVPGLVAHMVWDLFVMVLFPLTPPS
jgi:uncharacterized protein